MCRIAGIVGMFQDDNEREAHLKTMCDHLAHGGPDDEGFYRSDTDRMALGNRRLSLIDITPAGHMPMAYEGRYHITYNGEIYNFKELKIELTALGYQFQNHTDTEVILAAFAQWNVLSFCKLKGMFAFALWDDVEKELFLVRDPGGIKPLYYLLNEKGLVFASETHVLEPFETNAPNDHWRIYLMAFGHIPEPVTTIAGVRPLPKGCFLKYSVPNGRHSLQSFRHYSYSEHIQDRKEASKQVAGLLKDSVKRHMVSDAPLGVFLSGGLDSGIIALVASEYKTHRLNTLSLYFEEEKYSEKKYQDIVKERLNCNHSPYLLEEKEFNECLPVILDSMDMPSSDGINTWFISRLAKQNGIKAVLSGLGSDELFGGYPSFSRVKKARTLQDYGSLVSYYGVRSKNKVLNRFPFLKLEGIKGIYLFLRGFFSPYDIARHLNMDESEVWYVLNDLPVYQEIKRINDRNQAGWMEFNMYMQNQLLRDSDVMSMIHGIEIRVPYLYDDLIQYANAIHPSIKYRSGMPKNLLINGFKDILPVEIYNRPKMGFSLPFQEWLCRDPMVKELMGNANGILLKSYQSFLKGEMHWSQFLTLVLLTHREAIA